MFHHVTYTASCRSPAPSTLSSQVQTVKQVEPPIARSRHNQPAGGAGGARGGACDGAGSGGRRLGPRQQPYSRSWTRRQISDVNSEHFEFPPRSLVRTWETERLHQSGRYHHHRCECFHSNNTAVDWLQDGWHTWWSSHIRNMCHVIYTSVTWSLVNDNSSDSAQSELTENESSDSLRFITLCLEQMGFLRWVSR